jgi:hypothetical protein
MMAVTATRPEAIQSVHAYDPVHVELGGAAPSFDLDAAIAGNPVARAHTRARERSSSVEESSIGRVLVWTIVVPTLFFLASNPVGWLLLFLLTLGIAALTGFGGIL